MDCQNFICIDVRCPSKQRLFQSQSKDPLNILGINNIAKVEVDIDHLEDHVFVQKQYRQDKSHLFSLKLNKGTFKLYMDSIKQQLQQLNQAFMKLEQIQEGEGYIQSMKEEEGYIYEQEGQRSKNENINQKNGCNKQNQNKDNTDIQDTINNILSKSDGDQDKIQDIFQAYKTSIINYIKNSIVEQADQIENLLKNIQSEYHLLKDQMIDYLIRIDKPLYSFKPNPQEKKVNPLKWMTIKEQFTLVQSTIKDDKEFQISLIDRKLPNDKDSKVTLKIEEKGKKGVFFGMTPIEIDKLGEITEINKYYKIGNKGMKVIDHYRIGKEELYSFIETGDIIELIYKPSQKRMQINNLNPLRQYTEFIENINTTFDYYFFIQAFDSKQQFRIIHNQQCPQTLY